jgi:hypothetical protein
VTSSPKEKRDGSWRQGTWKTLTNVGSAHALGTTAHNAQAWEEYTKAYLEARPTENLRRAFRHDNLDSSPARGLEGGGVLGTWTSPSSPPILAKMRERERERLFGRSKAHVYLLNLEIYSTIVITLRIYKHIRHDRLILRYSVLLLL